MGEEDDKLRMNNQSESDSGDDDDYDEEGDEEEEEGWASDESEDDVEEEITNESAKEEERNGVVAEQTNGIAQTPQNNESERKTTRETSNETTNDLSKEEEKIFYKQTELYHEFREMCRKVGKPRDSFCQTRPTKPKGSGGAGKYFTMGAPSKRLEGEGIRSAGEVVTIGVCKVLHPRDFASDDLQSLLQLHSSFDSQNAAADDVRPTDLPLPPLDYSHSIITPLSVDHNNATTDGDDDDGDDDNTNNKNNSVDKKRVNKKDNNSNNNNIIDNAIGNSMIEKIKKGKSEAIEEKEKNTKMNGKEEKEGKEGKEEKNGKEEKEGREEKETSPRYHPPTPLPPLPTKTTSLPSLPSSLPSSPSSSPPSDQTPLTTSPRLLFSDDQIAEQMCKQLPPSPPDDKPPDSLFQRGSIKALSLKSEPRLAIGRCNSDDHSSPSLSLTSSPLNHSPVLLTPLNSRVSSNKNYSQKFLLREDVEDATDRMRNRTINEILITERDYVDDLNYIIDEFYEGLHDILTEQIRTAIFSNITIIRNVNRKFLEQLEEQTQHPDGPSIAKCFFEITSCHKIYADYCNNHSLAGEVFNSQYKKSAPFRAFIDERMMKASSKGLPFQSYLIKPVQRICKYPLLIRELIKHTREESKEYSELKGVLADISEHVTSINQSKREAENLSKITKIERMIGSKTLKLHQPGREFIKEGVFDDVAHEQSVYIALFNDVLLLCLKKSNKFGTLRILDKYRFSDLVPLYTLIASDIHGQVSAFEVRFAKKRFVLEASSVEEKEEWVAIIKAQIKIIYNLTHNTPNANNITITSTSTTSLSVPSIYNNNNSESNNNNNDDDNNNNNNNGGDRNSPLLSRKNDDNNNGWSKPKAPSFKPSKHFQGNKVKCYIHKGKENQRIRKISLFGINSVGHLKQYIRMEFEWHPAQQFDVSYATAESNHHITDIQDDDPLSFLSSVSYFVVRNAPSDACLTPP